MNKVLITIGSVDIYWYSALIIVGALIALFMIMKEGRRYGVSTDFLFNMCFWTIIVGIIGARAYYVLFNLEYYHNFWDVFKVWEGGLAIHGGIIAGFITMIFYCKKYNAKITRITDLVAPGLLLAQAIGRWGNFFNGEAHGAATTLARLQELHIPQFVIDGMNIGGVYYEPTFFYESLWCLLGIIIILIIRRLKYTKVGQPTAFYLIWYGAGRLFIEMKRTDSLMLGGFKVAQIVSIGMIIIGLVIILLASRRGRYENLYNQDESKSIRF